MSARNAQPGVLLVGTFAPTPDYLISIYADLPDAASLPFWLRTSFKPRRGLPVSALRYSNVVVAGLMTKSDVAASDKAFATLKP